MRGHSNRMSWPLCRSGLLCRATRGFGPGDPATAENARAIVEHACLAGRNGTFAVRQFHLGASIFSDKHARGHRRPRRAHLDRAINDFGRLDDFVERADRFRNELIIAAHFSTRYHPSEVRRLLEAKLPPKLKAKMRPWV